MGLPSTSAQQSLLVWLPNTPADLQPRVHSLNCSLCLLLLFFFFFRLCLSLSRARSLHPYARVLFCSRQPCMALLHPTYAVSVSVSVSVSVCCACALARTVDTLGCGLLIGLFAAWAFFPETVSRLLGRAESGRYWAVVLPMWFCVTWGCVSLHKLPRCPRPRPRPRPLSFFPSHFSTCLFLVSKIACPPGSMPASALCK